ncbi:MULTISPECIES: FAD-dependent oxidoreductase [Rhodanobacter]|uniref:FAD-dependent oxidoreductase n=1 Tax=Rhodanobacter TaxID=75309 RepID=UPI0004199B24|nr:MULTISPECIES: NAD(P)/FAD-dependent oxidoreductase [Rhodanobacter]TAN19285.1 MAG: FAD-dependent monooxygenase [Rhodanobacter sp.]UJJ53820.1 FAD-dependent monooxygenase [Rhodanobacter thiooxydans]
MAQQPITLIGGGLVGTLLAQQLARRGFAVEVFEKRPDPRRAGFLGGCSSAFGNRSRHCSTSGIPAVACARSTGPSMGGGRSINLALAERGLQALRTAGLADDVLQRAVMMRGRMVHDRDGRSALQRYGVDDSEVIWSVSRGALNMLLLDAAEAAGVRFHFGQSLTGADFGQQRIRLADEAGTERERDAGLLIGADGAGSALRAAMNAYAPLGERIESLGHGYKELEIPPAGELPAALQQQGSGREQFALEPHALHIWPRGGYMCIALPNAEGSFTVTLFLPAQGAAPSFAALPDVAAARTFFATDFPDLLPLIPRFDEDFDSHPVGTLSTLYLERWHLDGRALLIGDAAHAIVPFHGQGMNCGFEDTVALADLLAAAPDDSAGVFAEFQRVRQPNADAIAAMALENYVEMRDSVADPRYLAKRELGSALAARIPGHYMARYRLVTFTHVPYAYALERGRAQDRLLEQLLRDTPNAAAVDLDAAGRLFQAKLEPLPRLRHG